MRAPLFFGLLLTFLGAACAHTPRVVFDAPEPLAHEPRRSDFDVDHYALDLEILPQTRSLVGRCTVRLFAREKALTSIELDLRELEAVSVRDERGRELLFEHDGSTLRFFTAEALAPRALASFEVQYRGAPRTGMWFVRERDGVPTQIYTQGECEDSSGWFPCFDAPSERATSEIRVVLPRAWRSLAAGEFLGRVELDGERAAERWRMTTAHPAYLTTLVAGELLVEREEWDGVALEYWAAPEFAEVLGPSLASTPRVLEHFSELTGLRYPWPKYAQSCVDNFRFGGMENVTATTLTDAVLTDELGRRDADPVDLIAHEAAHQWFGDLLTCHDWSEIWLNEGFATYFSELHRETLEGVDAFRASMRDVQESYLSQDVGAGRRPTVWNTYRDPMDLFTSGHAYPGGAARLHLLRFFVGDAAFFRGLKRYVADNVGRSVTSADLRAAFERESGLDLRLFFEQWVTAAGFPEIAVAWTWDAPRQRVYVDVEQVQKPLNGTPNVFVVPVDIEVRDETGARTTRVTLDQRRQRFELAASTRPTWVVFDKHGWIPKRVALRRSTEEWIALAAHDDDVNGRRDALLELGARLADSRDDKLRWRIVEVVFERLVDPSPAVRAAAARAFERVHTKPDHPIARALMRAASTDASAAVRVAALESLARWETRDKFAGFALQQYEARFSYATMGAAARLLAGADPERAQRWIASQLADAESPHDVLRAQLLRALATLPGRDVDERLLRAALDRELRSSPREMAVRELARRASTWPRARQAFVEILAETPWYRLQNAAIDALGEVGDPSARAVLKRRYATATEPRQRRAIERALTKSQP
jgi:aminopeptidase N